MSLPLLPSVSVVVPTHERRDRIERCIDALLADPAATEVVVVVDGSRDGTLELLEQRATSEPRLVPVFIEHGGDRQAARQAGAERATGEVILCVDDDVIAQPGLVTGHARHHADRSGIVVVGYMPTVTHEPRRPGMFASHLYAENYEWACARWSEDPDAILRGFWGGNCSLRRDDALRVGLVSPTGMLPYGEDRDLGLRLLRAGVRAEFDRSLVAAHEHHRDLDGFLREARARATGAQMIHDAHADLIGPLELERYEVALPLPARWAVRGARARSLARAEVVLLRGLIRAAGAVHWWKLESLAAIVAMHVIEVRTILERDAPRP